MSDDELRKLVDKADKALVKLDACPNKPGTSTAARARNDAFHKWYEAMTVAKDALYESADALLTRLTAAEAERDAATQLLSDLADSAALVIQEWGERGDNGCQRALQVRLSDSLHRVNFAALSPEAPE